MNSSFVGRDAELHLLDRLWKRSGAALLILYGRRRVGKTRLLTHWLQRGAEGESGANQPGRRVLYWVAEPSSALDQLRSFSQAVYNFANPAAPAPLDFTYATWSQAWQQVAALAQNERLALFIDEFTYLLEIDPSIAGQLQNLWDHTLSQANLFLVICGSHLFPGQSPNATGIGHPGPDAGGDQAPSARLRWRQHVGGAMPGVAAARQRQWRLSYAGRSGGQRLDAHGADRRGWDQLNGEAAGARRVQMGRRTAGRSVLASLAGKTAEVIPGQGQWQVQYLGFARAGWTAASHAFAQELNTARPAGQRWQVVGLRLLDLDQVDRDLTVWAA